MEVGEASPDVEGEAGTVAPPDRDEAREADEDDDEADEDDGDSDAVGA
jgi:hypothetical protein